MRVLYLLLLLPLAAFASCPAGLSLSNVPIHTALPYCVKWDSSTKGGCEVSCPGVCVEFPEANTKGPISTTGNECSLGSGGGDGDGNGGDGGDGGDTGNGDSGGRPNDGMATGHVGPMPVGEKGTSDIAPGFNAILKDLWFIKNASNLTSNNTRDINLYSKKMQQDVSRISANMASLSNVFSQGMDESNFYLKSILDKMNSSPSGGDGDGEGSKDIYDELKQFHLDTFGPNFAQNNEGGNFYDLVRGYQYDVNSIKESVHNLDTTFSSFHWTTSQELRNNSIEMNRNIKAIAEILKGNGGTGGDGSGEGSGGADIDYSKMPGSGDNPLQVADGDYKSSCQGEACFFDVAAVSKQYEQRQGELKDKFQQVRKESESLFKYNLSGAAETPKCFDLFSYNGKEYSVCPESGEFWEIMAAVLMFIFYFVAFMILARR